MLYKIDLQFITNTEFNTNTNLIENLSSDSISNKIDLNSWLNIMNSDLMHIFYNK